MANRGQAAVLAVLRATGNAQSENDWRAEEAGGDRLPPKRSRPTE